MSKEQNTPGIERRRFRPYPKYKDSGVKWLATVPSSWPICAVKHRFDIFLGKMLQPEPASPHDLQVPYLKAANVQWENIGLNSLQTMWASKYEIQTGQVAIGDLLVCEGGEVGRAAIIDQKPEEPIIIQNALHRVRSQSEMPKFLMYLLEVSASGGWLEVECNKATIQHFTRDKFGSLRIALPSLDEQCRIVSFLDRETAKIDVLIEKKERLIELLQEKRTALITQAVTKGLDPTVPMKDSGVEWLGRIPVHWKVLPAKRMGVFKAGAGFPDAEQGIADEALPFYKVADLAQAEDEIHVSGAPNSISFYTAKRLRASVFPAKTIIFPKVGAALRLNRRRILTQPACIDNNVMGFVPDKCDYKWAFYWMRSIDMGRLANPGAVPSVNEGQVREVLAPLPPPKEQHSIARFLDEEILRTRKIIERISTAIACLDEYRIALISAAVTGKLDVRLSLHESNIFRQVVETE